MSEEVSSESGTILLMGFGGCVELMVGNDSREYLGRRSHFRDVRRYTYDGEASGRVGECGVG